MHIEGHVCDVCNRSLTYPEVMYRCHKCNWDVCETCKSKWQPPKASASADNFKVGKYTILHDDTWLNPSVEPSHLNITHRFPHGSVVNILDIQETPTRIRGQVEKPRGWISLMSKEDGYTWVRKTQELTRPERLAGEDNSGDYWVLRLRCDLFMDEVWARVHPSSAIAGDDEVDVFRDGALRAFCDAYNFAPGQVHVEALTSRVTQPTEGIQLRWSTAIGTWAAGTSTKQPRQPSGATLTVRLTGHNWGFLRRPQRHTWAVCQVDAGGQAERAGMVVGHIITHVDGTEVSGANREAMRDLLAAAGDRTLTLTPGASGWESQSVLAHVSVGQHWDAAYPDQKVDDEWRLYVGNTHRNAQEIPLIPMGRASGSSGPKNVHEWGMFLSTSPTSVVPPSGIKSVQYRLHHTFVPHKVSMTQAPYWLVRRGWGTFTVRLNVDFSDGRPVRMINHALDFGHDLTTTCVQTGKVTHVTKFDVAGTMEATRKRPKRSKKKASLVRTASLKLLNSLSTLVPKMSIHGFSHNRKQVREAVDSSWKIHRLVLPKEVRECLLDYSCAPSVLRASTSQTVEIRDCDWCEFNILGKVKTISIVDCQHIKINFQDVIASTEIYRSADVKVRCNGSCYTYRVETSADCSVLFKDPASRVSVLSFESKDVSLAILDEERPDDALDPDVLDPYRIPDHWARSNTRWRPTTNVVKFTTKPFKPSRGQGSYPTSTMTGLSANRNGSRG